MSEHPYDIPDQLRLSSIQRANLVAYLDGELSGLESQEIDAILTRSHTARREVEVLTRTWEMLELLPHPKVSPDFSTRTLERIRTAELRHETLGEKWQQAGRRALVTLGWIISLAAAAGIGFLVLRFWSDPSRAMLDDLPVLEELDMYREVEDMRFLDQLYQSGEFK